LLLRFAGALLLRFAARQFLALLFHEPPRRTRLFDFALLRNLSDERGPKTNFFFRARPPAAKNEESIKTKKGKE